MTLTNTVAAKLSVAFVAIAMVFSLVAPAQAQTADELQATIDALMAEINALNSQIGVSGDTMTSSSSVCPYTWTRALNMGATGDDVMKLQMFLNASADTQVAAAGSAGSAGMETDYYGPATGAAVSKFQAKYRTDILSPLGLVNPTTFFGPSTMAKANALCVSAPVVVDDVMDDSSDDDSSDDDSSDDTLNGGEADVNSVDGRDEDDEVAEGDEDVAVHRVEFDVEDGDVRLERVDVTFDGTAIGTDGENEPWDAFDEISIWVDGDKIASEDVTDEDDWDEDATDVYSFRLTNVDTIFREDTSPEVIIAVSAAGSVDVDGDAGEDDWTVYIATDGMRFMDGEGLDIEVGPGSSDGSTFEMIEESDNDDLDLESSDEDPDATTFALDEDDNKDYMIFAFELSAEDSDNDIDLDDLYVDVTVGSTDTSYDTLDELVDDFYIEIDGETFDAESYTGTAATETDIQFDVDNEITINADEYVTVYLYATFNDVASSFTNATVTASTSPNTINADGADSITADGSSIIGNTHTLRLDGFDVQLSSEDTTLDENSDTTSADDEGEFELVFDVTAFGDDLYIPFGAATATDLTAGFEFSILDNNNAVVDLTSATTTVSDDVDDGDAEETNSYKVAEGTTEQFTVTVKYDPATSGSYKLRLDTVNFTTSDAATATNAQDVSDLDIDTAKLTI